VRVCVRSVCVRACLRARMCECVCVREFIRTSRGNASHINLLNIFLLL